MNAFAAVMIFLPGTMLCIGWADARTNAYRVQYTFDGIGLLYFHPDQLTGGGLKRVGFLATTMGAFATLASKFRLTAPAFFNLAQMSAARSVIGDFAATRP